MTPRHLLRTLSVFIFAGGALAAASALAERTLVEGTIQIDGQRIVGFSEGSTVTPTVASRSANERRPM